MQSYADERNIRVISNPWAAVRLNSVVGRLDLACSRWICQRSV